MFQIKEEGVNSFKRFKVENSRMFKSMIDSGLIGIGISIVFLFNFNGPTLNPRIWAFYIVFGFFGRINQCGGIRIS